MKMRPSRARFSRRQWIRQLRRMGYDVTVSERPGSAPCFSYAVSMEIALAAAQVHEPEILERNHRG